MAPSPLVRPAVLDILADGNWHSGVALGETVGRSRAAIWKQVRTLRGLGLTIVAERRRGYRLECRLDLLSVAGIKSGLAPATRNALPVLDVLVVTTSTNKYLTVRPAPPPGHMWAAVAEYQTGGRGRRGRRWLSPLGHGVCLSISWCFEVAPRELAGLSLVAGVAVVRGLEHVGMAGAQLKWPNDVMAAGAKVGGILVEVSGEPNGPLRVVIGIGLNVRPVTGIAAALLEEGGNSPAVALDDLMSGRQLERNALIAALLNSLHTSLLAFVDGGWQDSLAAWRRCDYLLNRHVVVSRGRDTFEGVAHGIADDGALLVESAGRIIPVVAGDVTLRRPTGMRTP